VAFNVAMKEGSAVNRRLKFLKPMNTGSAIPLNFVSDKYAPAMRG